MPRGNPNKLQPVRNKQEASELGKKGGVASGEARRAKSTAKDIAKMVLAGKIPADEAKNIVKKMGLPDTELNVQAAILAGTALAGINGNVKATEYLLSLVGEAPGESASDQTQTYTGLPARVLGEEYVNINRDIDARRHRFYDYKGGRGSLKSSFCGLKLIDQIMLNPGFCAMAVMNLKDTLKDGVYSQIVWAIDELELTEEFHCTKSPLEITRRSTGQKIYFRGGDEPYKIKSIRPPNGMHIGITWIEEADQISDSEKLRSIIQSTMRGGDDKLIFRSYNTPRSKSHYINEEEREPNEQRLIHHSFYYNAPKEWLGQPFFDEAERLKRVNERAYRHEYLGEATGTGANVFDNIEERKITQEELDRLDMYYYGLDWGFVHPTAFNEMAYDHENMVLYIFGEKHLLRTTNRQTAEILEEYKNCRITADSASPESVADLRDWGFDIRAAVKGPGSRDYSYKWLASLAKIIIDGEACPETAHEFSSMEYVRDKDGKLTGEIPKKCDDHIDSVRYALETVWKRRGQ